MNQHIFKDCTIAVDFGGTKMLVGAVDREGNILDSKRFSTGVRDQESSTQRIIFGLDHYFTGIGLLDYQVKAIGIGIVGNVDPETGYWNIMYGEEDKGMPLGNIIENRYGVPCAIDNDVKAATIAELDFGIGQTVNDFIYLNIGTGIAAGFVCDRKLVRGANNDAGEIGHIFIENYEDVKCWCGRSGCFEALSSGHGIEVRYATCLKDISEYSPNPGENAFSVSKIFERGKEDDPCAKRIAVEAADAIRKMILNLIKTFDPGAVVLNGGVMGDEWFTKMIRDNLILNNNIQTDTKISVSKIDPNLIGLIGAASIGFGKLTRTEEKIP
jgi:glucokinase